MNPQEIKRCHQALKAKSAQREQLATLAAAHAAAAGGTLAQDLEAARLAYEDACAANTLGELSDEALGAVRSQLNQAKAALQTAEAQNAELLAARAGMARRLQQAEAEEAAASAALQNARVTWVRAELMSADAAYATHAQQAAAAALRHESLKSWLTVHSQMVAGPTSFRKELVLPVLGTESFKAAAAAHHQSNPGEAWQFNVFPRIDPVAANRAIQLEMAALTEEADQTKGATGLFDQAVRAVKRLAA